ncbi:FCN2-like protein [Mya arenaria]|uniref:FCN2-like protein n=1 Tax=Mya arenaria TaxID=6604 RepID=A0ABY7G704_MYAAR|nr:FCN2-like protein [Mya arenaria]
MPTLKTTFAGLAEQTSRRHNNTLRIDLESANGTRGEPPWQSIPVPQRPAIACGYTLYLIPLYKPCFIVNQPGSLYPYHNGMLFSTFDHDHDHWHYSNCAVLEHGAWWYNDCYYANLNGQYDVPGTHNPLGMTYDAFMGTVSLKGSKMMFR